MPMSLHSSSKVALGAGYAALMSAALVIAAVWPRAGEPAVLAPHSPAGFERALSWAGSQGARIVALDTQAQRLIIEMPSQASAWSALQAGLIPLSATPPRCTAGPTGSPEYRRLS